MNEKNRGDIIPGVGCDVTNCKYNTIDCKCSAYLVEHGQEPINW